MSRVPVVSVCVPTYNYGRFLPDCLESVLNQTIDDWELIVCDDCSEDNTPDIVQAYSEQDKRIRYLRNDERLGMNANIKRAADLGRGRYLKILCSDDWLAPTCLQRLCALLEHHPSAVLATCAVIQTDAEGQPTEVNFLFGQQVSCIKGERMLDRMAKGSGFGGNSTFLIRSSAYRAIGGYRTNMRYAPDYDLAARLCRIGDYIHTDEPLVYGRRHSASSSSRNPKRFLDVLDWFDIPERIFAPRPLGSREWRRYHVLMAHLTARYTLNALIDHIRGEHERAFGLWRILRVRGHWLSGVPFLLLHVPARFFRWLTGRNRPRALPPEPWMGRPQASTETATQYASGSG